MQTTPDIIALNESIKNESAFITLIQNELSKVIIGQQGMVEGLLIGLLADGHVLLEGVPGLAKTLAINSLSQTIGASFSRVQFTPDLLPSDIIGTQIYNMSEHLFETKKGPVFSNFVVTLGDKSYPLPKPFLVMATQNPVEQEGTYPLPEAQMDRFLLKITLTYPEREDERTILRNQLRSNMESLNSVVSTEQILKARTAIDSIYMDEKIESYILDIVFATRFPKEFAIPSLSNKISFGASPRGSIALAKAAKCHAFLRHRGFVIPEDVRAVAPSVLRHRIGLTYEAEAEEITQDDIVTEVLNTLMVP